jgi:MFS family permease
MLLMKLPEYVPKISQKKVFAEFAEGFSYIKKTQGIGLMIALVAVTSLLVLPYNTVLPVFAKVVFKGNASTFGYITSFVGVGAVTGTIFLASRKPGAPLKKILFISSIVMGIGLIFFSQVRNFPLAMFFAALAGFGSMAQFTICNIVVQSESATEMRGRAIGILLMAIFGMLPVGSLLIGAVSEYAGAPATVLGQGIIAILIALSFSNFLMKRNRSGVSNDVSAREGEEIIAENI